MLTFSRILLQRLRTIFFVGKYNGGNYFCSTCSSALKQTVGRKKEISSKEIELQFIVQKTKSNFHRLYQSGGSLKFDRNPDEKWNYLEQFLAALKALLFCTYPDLDMSMLIIIFHLLVPFHRLRPSSTLQIGPLSLSPEWKLFWTRVFAFFLQCDHFNQPFYDHIRKCTVEKSLSSLSHFHKSGKLSKSACLLFFSSPTNKIYFYSVSLSLLVLVILVSLLVSARNRLEDKRRQVFTQNALQTTRFLCIWRVAKANSIW